MVLVNGNKSLLVSVSWMRQFSGMKSIDATDPELVAGRLKAVRKYLGLTQAAFAEAAGFQRNAYQMVEGKKQTLSRDMLIGLCVRYGLTADFILFGEVHTLPFHLATALSASESEADSSASADED